jgi:hypothetical protein
LNSIVNFLHQRSRKLSRLTAKIQALTVGWLIVALHTYSQRTI